MQKTPLAEFVYNNSVYSTTRTSLFFAIYKYHPNTPSTVRDDRPEGEVPTAREAVEKIKSEGKALTERWQRAIEF